MKRISFITFMLAVAVAVSGCVSDVEVTGSAEQALCTIEDQQAGTCTLRILTRDTARSQVPTGETIVNETYGVCSGNICAIRVELPTVIITAACIKDPETGVVSCSSASCTRGQGNCPG